MGIDTYGRASKGFVIIYALFLCAQATGSCSPYPTMAPPAIYKTLEECQASAKRVVPYRPPEDGRYILAPGIWYECRSKHVDTWEPAR
jgi:hypothetical protein